MSVRDKREPFAWVTLRALELIRRELPGREATGARNAVLSLVEAAARRHDGHHAQGDTISELATYAGLTPKRLRPHLLALERLGIIETEARTDEYGRTLPTIYTLLDGRDVSSHGWDGLADKSSHNSSPLRARVRRHVKNKNKNPSNPPQGGDSPHRDGPQAARRTRPPPDASAGGSPARSPTSPTSP